MALEQVLAVNPAHPQALDQVQVLRQQLGQPPAVAVPPPVEPVVSQSTAIVAPVLPAAAAIVAEPTISPPASPTVLPLTRHAAAEMSGIASDTLLAEDDPYQCA